ncbi:MAG: hypothetical protein Q7S43_00460 [bacterium]|nr:hypothetical protein [bacterium]
MPEPIYEKGQGGTESDTITGKFIFEVLKRDANSLAQLVSDVESMQSQMSEKDWADLGHESKIISDKIAEVRETIIFLKNGVEKIRARGQK